MKRFSKGNAMPMIIGLVVILAIAGGAFYFMNMSPTSTTDDTAMEDEAMMEDDDAMMEDDDSMMEDDDAMMQDADVEVTLEAGSYYFEPNVIEAEVGDTVKVTLENVEGFHDFVIDEFDAQTEQISEGETTTVTFVVDEAGEFEFYCSVGNHRQQGMVGTLTVTESSDSEVSADVEAELDL